MADYTDADRLVERVEALSERVDALDDARARALAQELVGAVIEMYGDGLRADRARRSTAPATPARRSATSWRRTARWPACC